MAGRSKPVTQERDAETAPYLCGPHSRGGFLEVGDQRWKSIVAATPWSAGLLARGPPCRGIKVDTDAFLADISAADPATHAALTQHVGTLTCQPAPDAGPRWVAVADAIKAGAKVSFHSDSPVSPVNPLQTIQCMVTRRTPSGQLHGVEQSISMDDALRAYTINAAYHLRREHDRGSIEAGKVADVVQLSADPCLVDPAELDSEVKVLGTWSGGVQVDVDAFMADIASVDPAAHEGLRQSAAHHTCC